MHIDEYLNENHQNEIDAGLISVRKHSYLPLEILNYTDKAQYAGHTENTVKCRGLIVDHDGLIVARPFEKFYNYQEPQAPKFDLSDKVEVFDKADGSLIIVADYCGKLVVASRGSFESDQAKAAYNMIASSKYRPDHFYTDLFELVGPSNRIVLEYDENTLLYLGAIDNHDGEFISPSEFDRSYLPWDNVQTFGVMSYGDALSMPPRHNAEGLVLRGAKGVVKVKQEDYVRLHKIVFGLTKRAVWDAVYNDALDELIDGMPDEFMEWTEATIKEILAASATIEAQALAHFDEIKSRFPNADRKTFAAEAREYPNTGLLFLLLDGQEDKFKDTIMKMVYPKHERVS